MCLFNILTCGAGTGAWTTIDTSRLMTVGMILLTSTEGEIQRERIRHNKSFVRLGM
jgi:hypothetical protein